MTNNKDILESDRMALEDKAGLAEIQDAIQQIERLKNGESISPEDTNNTSLQSEEQEEENLESEDSPEEESQEHEEEDEELIPEKEAPKKLDKIWKIKKSRHKALAEKRAALVALEDKERELAQLREMLAQAEVAGTYQYGRNVYSELDKAKEQVQRAIDEGNTKAFAEATFNLTNAQYKVNELEKLAASSAQTPQHQTYTPQINYEEVEREIIDDWISSHKELQIDSKYYNKNLADSVIKYANAIDAQLDATGRDDLRYSEGYFDAIEEHIAEFKNSMDKKRRNSESASHVGAVRNSYNSPIPGKSSKPIQVTLTPEEKKICASSMVRISEKEWLKHKAEQLKAGI